jgi:hypothetical protein
MQASSSLHRSGLGVELPIDFFELDHALAGRRLVRVLARRINEQQGFGFRHDQGSMKGWGDPKQGWRGPVSRLHSCLWVNVVIIKKVSFARMKQ